MLAHVVAEVPPAVKASSTVKVVVTAARRLIRPMPAPGSGAPVLGAAPGFVPRKRLVST
ncbi:hypothetical protein LUX57_02160 [Actinomadura madurae]|uniref:hypothetical protein n=1 Tax=Actinomadura madurae TaxID=1993 RepID=UPI0020D229DE|nr:hypothetical protein [Actinomadura madurae]MCP9964147.1 hypothetical protein [Actinomadura madurae]